MSGHLPIVARLAYVPTYYNNMGLGVMHDVFCTTTGSCLVDSWLSVPEKTWIGTTSVMGSTVHVSVACPQ